MEIVCEGCSTKLNVPDEKIPEGQRVSIKCPKCQHKVVIDPSERASPDMTPHMGDLDEPLAVMDESGAGEDLGGDALESYGEDENLALVLDPDAQNRNRIKAVLDELGYRSLMDEDAKSALKKMRLHAFDVVSLSDGFDQVPVEESPVTTYINRLSMSIRRRMFLMLISGRFKTMDRLTAFAMSANLVVNENDVNRLDRIVGMAISDNKKFYKVFTDTLKEMGRA
ncbi:MAG: zinc-ribbon domain-containing protein [Deltaproteobacteria bacterium]|nr:zinc-ribbon domain-containing protein [Deltaproteobacteria bacterium]